MHTRPQRKQDVLKAAGSQPAGGNDEDENKALNFRKFILWVDRQADLDAVWSTRNRRSISGQVTFASPSSTFHIATENPSRIRVHSPWCSLWFHRALPII